MFQRIRAALRFAVEAERPAEEPGDPAFDRLWKMRFIVDKINSNNKACLKPGQYICVDESMIRARSRLSWLVRIVGKPIRDGIKVGCRCKPDAHEVAVVV